MATPIPRIRARLHQLADLHNIPELHELAEETRRNPPVRMAPRTHRRMTRTLAAAIRAYAAAHPLAGCQEIGVVFRVHAGRVSETLTGKKWL